MAVTTPMTAKCAFATRGVKGARKARARAVTRASAEGATAPVPAAATPTGDAPAPAPLPVPPTMYPPTSGVPGQHQGYYYAPPPPPAKKSSGSDVPAWMWVGLGVALATVGGKIFGAKKIGRAHV